MSPYEYADLAQSNFDNAISSFAVILSIVSGYLITAYLVGAKLNRTQVTILTTMFLLVMGLLTWSMSAYTYWGYFWSTLVNPETAGQSLMSPRAWISGAVAILNLFTLAMCLLFMWNVRRAKATAP